jgi:colicin import membrane protein
MRQHPRPFIYALLVHLGLLAVLIFSLDWTSTVKPSTSRKHAPIQAVAVDARQLDAELQRKQQLEEQKRRAEQDKLKQLEEQKEAERKRVEAQKRQAELKRKQEQEAKRKAEAEKKRQSELALKKKAEAEKKRKEEEARKKAEAEKKRKEDEARKKAEAEQKRKAEEARRKAEQELQARLAAEQAREAAQRQSAMQRMVDEYVLYIQEKVQRSWIRPPSSGSELSCTVEVRLIPSGEVIDAQIVRSSGNSAFDRSVEAAVFKASPLPVPPDPDVMEQFRSLRFEFKPGAA